MNFLKFNQCGLVTAIMICFSFCQIKAESSFRVLPSYSFNQINDSTKKGGIADILKKVDTTELKLLIENEDEAGVEFFFNPLASEIAEYVHLNYNEDIRDSVEFYSLETFVLGLFYFAYENNIEIDKVDWLVDPDDCFFEALSGLLGISEINSLYHDFMHGVTPRTILRTMKTMLRRVASGITIALTVIELIGCLF